MKTVVWDKMALTEVRSYSVSVRQEIGVLLRLLQKGETLGMPQSRAMPQIGAGAFELRVRDRAGSYRVVYVLFERDRILVPHAFTKKTQKTPVSELKLAKTRLKRLVDEVE